MNKNIKALRDYTNVMMNPKLVNSFEGMSKFLGAINQIHYGVDPFKNEFEEVTLLSAEEQIDEDDDQTIVKEPADEPLIREGNPV